MIFKAFDYKDGSVLLLSGDSEIQEVFKNYIFSEWCYLGDNL